MNRFYRQTATMLLVLGSALPALGEITVNRSIRKVDFRNFTYRWTPDQGGGFFTLRAGRKRPTSNENGAILQQIEFGDVTGDGREEAFISIYPDTDGNCQCYMEYVYTLDRQKPKLLWSFDTWGKAKGGFKRAYADDGKLVVELFGDNKFEKGKWTFDTAPGEFKDLCCPTTFTRFKFQWNGSQFELVGKPELFDYNPNSNP